MADGIIRPTPTASRPWCAPPMKREADMSITHTSRADVAHDDAPVLPPCDHTPAPYEGPGIDEVAAMRREFLSPALFLYYPEPFMVVEGHMQYLFDEKGNRYLDALGGIVSVSVGHCHPRIIDAVREQNERLQHTTTIYLHPNIARFAAKLASTYPEGSGLGVTYFVNSGSEANDLAALICRARTGNFDLITLRNGYHGGSSQTMGMTAQSTWKHNVPQGFGVHHALLPDTYRGPWGADDPDAGRKYAEDVRNIIESATSGRVAGFFCEPIQGIGGVIEPPPGYLRRVYEIVRAAGGLCVSDEVQAGFGRTGDTFWGFERHGVVPDIVTMAKGIGNGCPLGAVTTRADIADALATRLHFNTFGGNPVSAAQGLATLETILDEKLQQRAREMGGYLLDGLRELQSRHTAIGDVRGAGLLTAFELVQDRASKTPAPDVAKHVLHRAKELGLLVGKAGYHGNVIRLTPPMCITRPDVDFLIRVIDIALGDAPD
jgi:alanine-glyoxylate transaminase/(R)-3-amino-2-methylpropionate-pyruvate transaminase